MTPEIKSARVSIGVKDKINGDETVVASVAAIISVPRLGWNDHWGSAVKALSAFSIPINRYTGAYWDHCLERCLEGCVTAGVDWAIALDYDSLITVGNVQTLLGLAAAYPHADAIASVQAKRSGGVPLLTMEDDDGKRITEPPREWFDHPLTEIATAHFGLTLLNVAKLATVPKPWFEHRAGPDGGWGEGRIDADVNFWLKWKAAGNSLFLANKIRIGHLQLMASYVAEDFSVYHLPVDEALKLQ